MADPLNHIYPEKLSSIITNFGCQLLGQTSRNSNLIFSPLSIINALGILYEGSSGKTKDELSTIFPGYESISVFEGLGRLISGLTFPEKSSNILEIMNSIWLQEGYSWEESFTISIQKELASTIRSLDLIGNPVNAAGEINRWISKNTRGLIDSMISPLNITEQCLLILANTIYFKANWYKQFSQPNPGKFKRLDRTNVEVDMIQALLPSKRYEITQDYFAVEIPYSGSSTAMTIVMPKKNGEKHMVHLEKKLPALLGRLPLDNDHTLPEVLLTMPEFKIKSFISLSNLLNTFGIQHLFSREANLSGISKVKPLWVDHILHGASIQVDRYGTEAAAVTLAVMMGGIFREEKKIEIVIDHPYYFVIHDKPSKAILFMGKVLNPTKSTKV